MAERFEAIVIGTGQAAPALCARLDKEGLKTALIERKLLGGTCVNVVSIREPGKREAPDCQEK